MYVLGDLLAEPDLGLELVSGGERARQRRVSGAHAIEVEHPATWLAPDWLMLTTGVELRGNARAQRALVAELDDAHVAALGFGVGLAFKKIPAGVLAEARARDFPVFEIPLRTPFREVIATVNRALLGGELRVYQRIWSMQRYLLDALGSENPQAETVERLHRLLGATVVIFSADGTVELARGEEPGPVWDGISARAESLIAEFELGGWHTVAAAIIRPGGGPPRWLAATSPRPSFALRLAKAAVQAAAPLLGAIARLGDLAGEQEHAVRGALLQEALHPGADGRSVAARAASLGIDFSSPGRVVALAPPSGRFARNERRGEADLAPLTDALGRSLRDAGLPFLAGRDGSAVIALVQGGDEGLRARLEAMAERGARARVGIGRAVQDVGGIRHSYRDAQLALRRAAREPTGVADFESFDLGTMLFSEIPEDRVRPKLDECLAPLREHPELAATLAAYFANDMDVLATAPELHVHPNTLRYRLARVEKLLGRSLKQPATVAELHIALQALYPSADL
jgi:purine catabolism regulator